MKPRSACAGEQSATRFADQHETTSTDPGVEAVHHAKRQRGCDGGVDGVAALFERLFRCLGRKRMHRHDCAGFLSRLAERQR